MSATRPQPPQRSRRRGLLSLGLLWVLSSQPAQARHRDEALTQVQRLLSEDRISEAATALAPLLGNNTKDPELELLRGELQFLQGEYAAGAERMRGALAVLKLPAREAQDLRTLADLAAATAEVTRGFAEQRSVGGHFLIRYRPGRDELLLPYASEALEKAYQALASDFAGIATGDAAAPATPVRVEIYDEVADLARVSTLTLQEIETSGTIALSKWNRLMIVSPKALLRGYPWLDTLTHEYTHHIVSRVAKNTVPIWLQEGLAKFEERRWRGPVGGGLTPMMEHLLATALAKKHFITFEQMSPSMAKLPSQEDTALAFAEVYTVIEFLHSKHGPAGITQLLREMAGGASDMKALTTVFGGTFAQFDAAWKAWLKSRKLRTRAGLYADKLHFKKLPAAAKKAGHTPEEDDSGELTDPKARNLMRLGGMLRARGRMAAAAVEYEKAQGAATAAGTTHPLLALKLARTYLDLSDPERAIAVLEPSYELYTDLAGISATLGTAYLRKGDQPKAVTYLESALAVSPFDPSVHCGLAEAYQKQADPRFAREQNACKVLGGR